MRALEERVQCDYDAAFIADVPNIESMPVIALAVVAGGASKLVTSSAAERQAGVGALKKLQKVNKVYKPAR